MGQDGAVARIPPPEPVVLWRRLVAEFPGSGFLAAAVIGSGIAAQIIGGIAGVAIIRTLYPGVTPAEAADIIVPHHRSGAESACPRGGRWRIPGYGPVSRSRPARLTS